MTSWSHSKLQAVRHAGSSHGNYWLEDFQLPEGVGVCRMQLETLSFCSFKSSNVSRNEYCKFMCGKGAKFRRWIASILFAIYTFIEASYIIEMSRAGPVSSIGSVRYPRCIMVRDGKRNMKRFSRFKSTQKKVSWCAEVTRRKLLFWIIPETQPWNRRLRVTPKVG